MTSYPAALDLVDAAAATIIGLNSVQLVSSAAGQVRPASPEAIVSGSPLPAQLTHDGSPRPLPLGAARAIEAVIAGALAQCGSAPTLCSPRVALSWGAHGVGVTVTATGAPNARGLADPAMQAAVERAGGTLRAWRADGLIGVSAVVPHREQHWQAVPAQPAPAHSGSRQTAPRKTPWRPLAIAG